MVLYELLPSPVIPLTVDVYLTNVPLGGSLVLQGNISETL